MQESSPHNSPAQGEKDLAAADTETYDSNHPDAEHIPADVLETSYHALYRNISYWVHQADDITKVPGRDASELSDINDEQNKE